MTRYESLAEYRNAGAEQKLAILGNEMVVPIEIIHGYAAILKKAVESGELQISDELKTGIVKITEAAGDLKELWKVLFSHNEAH